uniref:Metaxin glutathione S-transferase domain-containing protein n=1 Tax=Palpitomonas bilix TaxID=652834 RepID=A0A7S3FYU5_9EUKA|mmetsp:Transcript_14660/g.37459  ORF Transcript_14660/g.37459 Transcript_14660/m.37459 type:complete len:440 (+) Transcript_14660:1-1320(+)
MGFVHFCLEIWSFLLSPFASILPNLFLLFIACSYSPSPGSTSALFRLSYSCQLCAKKKKNKQSRQKRGERREEERTKDKMGEGESASSASAEHGGEGSSTGSERVVKPGPTILLHHRGIKKCPSLHALSTASLAFLSLKGVRPYSSPSHQFKLRDASLPIVKTKTRTQVGGMNVLEKLETEYGPLPGDEGVSTTRDIRRMNVEALANNKLALVTLFLIAHSDSERVHTVMQAGRPWLRKIYEGKDMTRKERKYLILKGMETSEDARIAAEEVCEALSIYLDRAPFFLGNDMPSRADCLVYAHLSIMYHLPDTPKWVIDLFVDYDNLARFVILMEKIIGIQSLPAEDERAILKREASDRAAVNKVLRDDMAECVKEKKKEEKNKEERLSDEMKKAKVHTRWYVAGVVLTYAAFLTSPSYTPALRSTVASLLSGWSGGSTK